MGQLFKYILAGGMQVPMKKNLNIYIPSDGWMLFGNHSEAYALTRRTGLTPRRRSDKPFQDALPAIRSRTEHQ
ncbi:MAG: hypothetical protein R2750_01290 [Bacteroidales bacterium]